MEGADLIIRDHPSEEEEVIGPENHFLGILSIVEHPLIGHECLLQDSARVVEEEGSFSDTSCNSMLFIMVKKNCCTKLCRGHMFVELISWYDFGCVEMLNQICHT